MAAKDAAQYLRELRGWQAQAAKRIRKELLGASPELTESIKWGRPAYEANGRVCYFVANASHITLGFFRGKELQRLDRRLEGSGMKMAHLKIHSLEGANPRVIRTLVKAAVALNKAGKKSAKAR